jgi:hypothetical protein
MARLPRSLVDARTLATPTRWRKLSMISAICARGEIAFRIVEGSINTDRFIEFLDALIEGAKRKIFLVVDNLRVHHAKRVSAWLGRQDRAHRTAVSATLRARIEPRRIPQPRLQDRLAKQRGQPRCRRTPRQSHRPHAKPLHHARAR